MAKTHYHLFLQPTSYSFTMKLICILLLCAASAHLTIEYSLAEYQARRAVRHTVQWGPCREPGDDAWMSIRTDEVRTAWSDVIQFSRPYPFGFPFSTENGIDCRPLNSQTLTCNPASDPVTTERRTVSECFPRPDDFDFENKVRARWAPLVDLLDTIAARMDSGAITHLHAGEDWSGPCGAGAEFQECPDGRFVFGPEQSDTALYTKPLAIRVTSTDLRKFWDLSTCFTGVTGPVPLIDCLTGCKDSCCLALDDHVCMKFDESCFWAPVDPYSDVCVQRDFYHVVLWTAIDTDRLYNNMTLML
jgi:hypothetical protein